ncbi:MAG: hypothetical protein CMJ70_04825 [Planctomycetaceae bacterium]|nr:hypothetical protein [Planctomycetaceae bacterium]
MEGLGKIWFAWQRGTNFTAILKCGDRSIGVDVEDGVKGRLVWGANGRFSCLLKRRMTLQHR